ncbi:MAG TPA: RNA polymerase sigma-70 factor [Candidatus Eisenbacteria bacterium]|nr:RNA polymerase sigma-70 factor [Candidatus Eisenbacteria bacterium]
MDRTATFEEHRGLLFSIAYRMLGTASDAEDVVQEAFLRWERAADADVASPKAFLSTVVTRLAIDHLRAARTQREEYVGPWLPEPLVDETAPSPADQMVLAESLSMAFLVVLEQLGAVERAVFILREVFDYDYAEIARIVGKTPEHCRQVLHRARERVVAARRRPTVSREEQERLTHQFLATIATGDVRALAAMLADDVVLWSDGGGKRVAARNPIRGSMRVARFFAGIWRKAPPDVTFRMALVNGQPGVVTYLAGRPYHVMVFDVADGLVTAVRAVVNPDKLRRVPDLH